MKITSSFNSVEGRQRSPSFKNIPPKPKYYPEILGKIGKTAGEYISIPEQKLFLAATALFLHPMIDLKFANEEQKQDSAIKSMSKAIAGGITGVTVRNIFLKITNHFIDYNKHNTLRRYFMPKKAEDLIKEHKEMGLIRLKQYNTTLGTLFAVLTMIMFTNSKIDVPLTSDIQDLITGVVKNNKSFLMSLNDVYNSRIGKISQWMNKRKEFLKRVHIKTSKIIDIIRNDLPKDNTPKIRVLGNEKS